VKALQNSGTVVAMTGDGINDGPALRAADVGITLGKSGTQVAREVADIVLLDDNLQTLLPAIRDGRRIHENIRTAIHYISATNASEVALMLISLALGTGAPLSPRQLLWINVVTDIFPELAVAVQPAERDIMQRPPRDPNAPIIGASDLPRLGRQSGVITATALACYLYGVARYGVGPQASTVAFLGLAAPQLLHAFSARSEVHTVFEASALVPNRFLQASVIGALAALTIGQFIPGIRSLLGTVPIGVFDYVICAAAGLASLSINEMFKSAAIPARQVAALPAPDIQNTPSCVQSASR
jgi:Ca2+-transporting ATPase